MNRTLVLDNPKMLRNYLIRNEADLLHESYNVTIDWPKPDKDILQTMNRMNSIQVVNEEGSIYTIKYKGEP